MSISFACPTCSFQLTTKDEHAGRTANCPRCQSPVTVPGRNPVPPPVVPPKVNPVPPPVTQGRMTSESVSASPPPVVTASSSTLLKKAESGDTEAMLQLAYSYNKNNDLASLEKIFYWVEKAAKLGNAQAQFELADIYRCENVPYFDMDKSFHWLEQSAQNGYTTAKHNLATFYLASHDIPQAFHWMQQASDEGDPNARRKMGIFYIEGVGVPVDKKRGLSLLHEAAAMGDETAKELLNSENVHRVANNMVRANETIICVGHLIVYTVVMIGCGFFGAILGPAADNLWLVTAYLGIGFSPFIATFFEYVVIIPKSNWQASKQRFHEEGFVAAIFQFIFGIPIQFLFFQLPKLIILFLISPIIAVFRVIRMTLVLLMRGCFFRPDLWKPVRWFV